MSRIQTISEILANASVFKTLALLNYKLLQIDSKNLFAIYQRQEGHKCYVYLDINKESYQILNHLGQTQSLAEFLQSSIAITHFNAQVLKSKILKTKDNYSSTSITDLKATTLEQVLIQIWQPRKRKHKAVSQNLPETIEAFLPQRGYQTAIHATTPSNSNLLLVLDHESLTPFFEQESEFQYGATTKENVVLLHSYNDIMMAKDYADHNALMVAYHINQTTPSYLEHVKNIIMPIQTDTQLPVESLNYFKQKLMALIKIVEIHSDYHFRLYHSTNQFTLMIGHSDKKTAVKTISAIIQEKNRKTNEWLMESYNIQDESQLRNYSHDEVSTGISVDDKFLSVTMQYNACNIINLSRSLLPNLPNISVTLQEYLNND